MENYTKPIQAETIPILDFTRVSHSDPLVRRQLADEVGAACRDTGFFYVVNHGIDAETLSGQFRSAEAAFRLPLAIKMGLHMRKTPSAAGYEQIGGQILDSQGDEAAPPDLKESFYCTTELDIDHPYVTKGLRNYGNNQWPPVEGFKEQTLAYVDQLQKLAADILRMLALSLDLPESYLLRYFEPPSAGLRMIRYPPHPASAEPNQLGAGAHTDWGGITILAQDEVGGLEVRRRDGSWISATPIPGTFVINLGDLMMRWTNGLYTSNMHRVKNNLASRDRYSMAYFFSPDPYTVIEPLPGCEGFGKPRLFERCTALEHITEMFERSFAPVA